jgi:hypothetical protein
MWQRELVVRIHYLFVSYWTLIHVFQNIHKGIKGKGYIAALVIFGQIKKKENKPVSTNPNLPPLCLTMN